MPFYRKLEAGEVPGKLKARPVQQPATPAFSTAIKKFCQAQRGKETNSSIITCELQMILYHHPSHAASSKSRPPDCALQIKLQMSEFDILRNVSVIQCGC